MARLKHIVLGFLILQIYVHAAPSDVSKLEEIAKVEQAEPTLDSVPKETDSAHDTVLNEGEPKLDSEPKVFESDSNSTETQRQKRWYNPYAHGFPPVNPFFPSFNNRDDDFNSGYYGGGDPLAQIHRRVQEIAHFVRQPPSPPPPHFPIFLPVLFIPPQPPTDCNCNPTPTTPQPDNPVTSDTNDTNTTPSINNRWPVMEDERQNWGFVINESDADDDTDYSRPISFEPIGSNRPVRPPPPIEHGSVQTDSNSNSVQPQAPIPSSTPSPQRPQTTRRPQNSLPPQNRPPSGGLAPPSRCDGAVLTCCHQPQVVYDCFAIQGCPDFTAYGNPCDPNLILTVIDRFQTYYGSRTG